MKIRITDDEFYEIKMPEQIGINEFKGIVMKFNFLLKNFSKFDIGNESEDNSDDIVLNNQQVGTPHNLERWKVLKESREIFVELLKAYYSKSPEELEELFKKYNIYFKRAEFSNASMNRMKEYHNLEPNEIGLSEFPTRTKPINDVIN